MSTTPSRPSAVPSPTLRRLERPSLPPRTTHAASPAVLTTPAVAPVASQDHDASSLRRQLAGLRAELARLRG